MLHFCIVALQLVCRVAIIGKDGDILQNAAIAPNVLQCLTKIRHGIRLRDVGKGELRNDSRGFFLFFGKR